jgi:vacuolar-type H+-ATPase subunit I/STV1
MSILFESTIKKKQGNNSNLLNISFDFKLIMSYSIAMMILFVTRAIKSSQTQIIFAVVLGFIIIVVSIIHKVKRKWSWPGASIKCIPSVLFQILFAYLFFAFASFNMRPKLSTIEIDFDNWPLLFENSLKVILLGMTNPTFAPWFFIGVGIVSFNILSILKVVVKTKSEFDSQCSIN